MPSMFKIPCESKAEAERVKQEITDVSKGHVKAETVQKGGKWFVQITQP